MTLDMAHLRELVATKFSDVEIVNESILRFKKKLDGSPYAVCYIDISEDLPQSEEALAQYQDQVIGRHYFEGRKSLQWNNYLYFLTKSDKLVSDEVRKMKDLIERDRNYARKFVISEEDLESILTPLIVAPADSIPRANVLTVWTEILTEAGLDKAIMSTAKLPTRLKQIESSHAALTVKPKKREHKGAISPEPFIRSLHLNKYLDYPRQKDFSFGTVNLIFGANCSGKTSLLEAIEFFYCARNKRNPNVRSAYELKAFFDNGRSEIVTANRELRVLRDRNLIWYGQSEVNTSNLYKSFAQFNFLDTDAAVSLADSTARIEDDLSKLLVGPDASTTWKDIVRVFEAVVGKLRDLHLLEAQITEDVNVVESQIGEFSGIRTESDLIWLRLKEMINRLGWKTDEGAKEKVALNYAEALSELISIAQQAIALDWTKSPVSINIMDEYCREGRIISKKVDQNLLKLGLLQKNKKKLDDSIRNDHEALDLAKEAKKTIDSGAYKCLADQSKLQTSINSYSGLLAGIDTDSSFALLTDYLDMKLSLGHEKAIEKSSHAETSLDRAKSEYENYCQLRDQSLNLLLELRLIADRILYNNSKPDECPLCHTTFNPGELHKRIIVSKDDRQDEIGQNLLTKIQECETALRNAVAIKGTLDLLKEFCELSKLSSDLLVRAVQFEVMAVRRKLLEAQAQLKEIDGKMFMYKLKGIHVDLIEGLPDKLVELGYPLIGYSLEDVDRLISVISESTPILSKDLEDVNKAIAELRQATSESLGSTGEEDSELKRAQSHLKERMASTESLLVKLRHFLTSNFPWPEDKSIAELVIEAESIRKIAADMQMTSDREKRVKDACAELAKRRGDLQARLEDLLLRMKRFKKAQSTLKRIISEHSLKSAMDSVLQQNRASIETIFKNIHSPVEFSGLGASLMTLVRQVGGSEAKLSEISTGQRAAFALSIFLAQNAQLKYAPPVVLIDDPIAHVDDLNCLAFLDYLREIALKGKRQIFFSTANDKLASLFQRKFDFLGPDKFIRINLNREL